MVAKVFDYGVVGLLFLLVFLQSCANTNYASKGGFLQSNYKETTDRSAEPLPISLSVVNWSSDSAQLKGGGGVFLSIFPLLSLGANGQGLNYFAGTELQPLEAENLMVNQLRKSGAVRSVSLQDSTQGAEYEVRGSINFETNYWLHYSGLGVLVHTLSLIPLMAFPQKSDSISVKAHWEVVRKSNGDVILSKDYFASQEGALWIWNADEMDRAYSEKLLPELFLQFTKDLQAIPASTWIDGETSSKVIPPIQPVPDMKEDSISRISLAVSDLVALGVDTNAAAIVSERIRTSLLATKAFRLLERQQMGLVLQEQGFQQSGACDSRECEVKIGQLLGVDQILAGSLGYTKGLYSVSLRLLDVATGEVLFSVTEDCACEIPQLLNDVIPKMAKVIATQKGSGILNVNSDPAGALVILDGLEKGKTPLRLDGVAVGQHKIILRKQHYQDAEDSVFVTRGKESVVNKALAGRGYLKVSSSPSGASVDIHGLHLGKTPVAPWVLPPGTYQASFSLPDYKDSTLSLDIHLADTTVLHVALNHSLEFLKKERQNHQRNLWIWRAALSAFAMGGFGYGYYEQTQANDAYDQYKNHDVPGDYTNEFDRVEDHEKKRNISYGLGAAFVGLAALTFAF